MKVTEEKKINGFKTSEIVDTVQAIQNNPTLANFEFRLKNQWVTGGHNRSTIQGFYGVCTEDTSRNKPFVYENAEPPQLLGQNEAANPVEFILHGLAGCLTTTLALHAAARGIEVDTIQTKLEGDIDLNGFLGIDESVRNGYKKINVSFQIDGDLSEEQKNELIEMTKSRSPVFDIVTNDVHVNISLAS